MSKSKHITLADLPARYQYQLAKQLYPLPPPVALKITGPKKRLRQSSKPLMNKLETAFMEHLIAMDPPSMAVIFPQAIRLELARGHWYKPDFYVPDFSGQENINMGTFYEVKGPHAFRGGFENLKVAARRFPFFTFTLVWLDAGQWKEQIILP